MKGPKKKNSTVVDFRGNPGKRKEIKFDVKLSKKVPTAPKDLNKLGKKEWKRAIKLMIENNIWSDLFYTTMFAYCHEYEYYQECIHELNNLNFEDFEKKKDYFSMLKNLNAIKNKCGDKVLKYQRELNLTPAQLGLKPEKKEDETDPQQDFLKGRK